MAATDNVATAPPPAQRRCCRMPANPRYFPRRLYFGILGRDCAKMMADALAAGLNSRLTPLTPATPLLITMYNHI